VISLPTDDPPLVSLADVRVLRGGRPILAGVTCDLTRGAITALVGLNGSGKSTLLRTLLGEFTHAGTITFRCGHDHSKPQPEHVGYVPQRLTIDALLPLTVRDFLAVAINRRPRFLGLGNRTTAIVRTLLDRVALTHLLDVPVDGLSGGQLQRVMLALALAPQPELLLLDEPAAGIDFRTQATFYQLLADINRDTGVTVLLVSHDLGMVKQVASHALCLHAGRITAQGRPDDVLSSQAVADTFRQP
jgi:zinc transport system ATP-binding protein